jgi:putative ABC transport system substrate-binding protein
MRWCFALVVVCSLGCVKQSSVSSALMQGPSSGRSGARVAVVVSDNQSAYVASAEQFRLSLEEHCDDCRVSSYTMRGDEKTGEQLFEALREDPPTLVYTLGIKATYLATKHLPNQPIVFSSILYLEKYKERLFEAAKKLCGVSSRAPMANLFAHVRMMASGSKSLGVVYSPDRAAEVFERAKQVGAQTGLQVVPIAAELWRTSEALFMAQIQAVDSVWAVADPITYEPDNFERLVALTRKLKRPLLSYSETFVERGALFSVSVDYPTVGRQVAGIVVDILKGTTRAEDVGVVAPLGTRWVVNAEAIRSLKLKVPEFVQQQFDRVVGTKD